MRKLFAFIFAITVLGATMMVLPSKKSTNHENTCRYFNKNNQQYTLVCFWASYNAASREENIRFSKVLNKFEQSNAVIGSVSVSLDEYESLFLEVVKEDQLKFSNIVREKNGFAGKLAKEFNLSNQFGSFLIDQKGEIIHKNFTPEQLEKYLYSINFDEIAMLD